MKQDGISDLVPLSRKKTMHFVIVHCEANRSMQCTSRPPSRFNHTGGGHLKGNCDLNNACEKAGSLQEQKCTSSQFLYFATNITVTV